MKKTKKTSVAKKRVVAKKPAKRKRSSVTYEPKPVKTTGWAPFRYPLQ
jgi:hypothetical protein